MTSENRKARDMAKLEAFHRRSAGRQCAVDDCFKRTNGGSRYCRTHMGRYSLVGNPEGILPTRDHYGPYVDHVQRLLGANPNHPAILAALKLLKAWLQSVVDRQDVSGKFRTYAPAEQFGIAFIQHGLDLRSFLIEGAACWTWMLDTKSCMDMKDEAIRSLTYTLTRLVPRRKDSKGQRRPWLISERKELAKWLQVNLMPFFSNTADGVHRMLEADKQREADMRKPFDMPPPTNKEADDHGPHENP